MTEKHQPRRPPAPPPSPETEDYAPAQRSTIGPADSGAAGGFPVIDRNPLPAEVGKYRIVRKLGQGGMGVVYEGHDRRLDRSVAIKMMLPITARDPDSRARFVREGKALAALDHDNVVTVIDDGEHDGTPFIVMPLLRGRTLEEALVGDKPMSLDRKVEIAEQVARGLAAAHTRGLVHRDVKPVNIWLEDNPDGSFRRAKVMDFGLVKDHTGPVGVTQTGMCMGTYGYMSLEQMQGTAKVDARTDLFSLGVVLYRLLTGRLPFPADSPIVYYVAVSESRPRPVRSANPEVPAGLGDLVERLLAPNPDDRPPSAAAVADSLANLLMLPPTMTTAAAANPPAAQPPPPPAGPGPRPAAEPGARRPVDKNDVPAWLPDSRAGRQSSAQRLASPPPVPGRAAAAGLLSTEPADEPDLPPRGPRRGLKPAVLKAVVVAMVFAAAGLLTNRLTQSSPAAVAVFGAGLVLAAIVFVASVRRRSVQAVSRPPGGTDRGS